ncbi:MAG: hypothetical protein K9I29_08555 [Bacteroidales bacterium]|nr:hypothetical protein [Bacteroidales bacterium]MCF8328334.1 hypothetical protein [Bacteroidales bacterium]
MEMKERNTTGIISEAKVRELAKVHQPFCVSIFLPTMRTGIEIEKKQQIRFKNILKALKEEFKKYEWNEKKIKDYLQPLTDLMEDGNFWRRQLDGLALFLNADGLEYFSLPIRFRESYYVHDHFYLKPVLSLFNNDRRFYILALNLKQVKLYEASRFSINEIKIDDLVPKNVQDVVGYDYEQKTLQSRPDQGGRMKDAMHGHGSGKDDKDEEITAFMQAVNNGLTELLNNEEIPLLLFTEAQHKGELDKVFDYKYVYSDYVQRNPEGLDIQTIHQLAWEKMEPYFMKSLREYYDQIKEKQATDYVAKNYADILPAAFEGRVEALFLNEGKEQYGSYDGQAHNVQLDSEKTDDNAALMNMAAVQTFLHNGAVFLLDSENMPLEESDIIALYRYAIPDKV